MAEHAAAEPESLIEKIAEKFHHDSSSSSDSEDEKKPEVVSAAEAIKTKIFRLFGREKPVHHVLGGGKPADILLWRNKKISAGVLGTVTAIWVLFELLEYHLLTLICHSLILSLAVLFLWSNASTFINKSPPRIPEVSIPEEHTKQIALALIYEINRGLAFLRGVASGRDLKKFLTVIAGLWVLSFIGGSFNFLTLFYLLFVTLHTVPVLYEKYEDQVDAYSEKGAAEFKKYYAKALVEFNKHYSVVHAKYIANIPKGALKDNKLH